MTDVVNRISLVRVNFVTPELASSEPVELSKGETKFVSRTSRKKLKNKWRIPKSQILNRVGK